MGWRLKGTGHRIAFFKMPEKGHANLLAFDPYNEHFTPEGTAEGHSRFCFRTANLEQALKYFQEHGVECSEPVSLPDDTLAADIITFGGAKLTLTEDRKLEGRHPESRVLCYGLKPLWLGVTDLMASQEWFEKMLGLKPAKKNYMEQGFALMRDEKCKWDFVWLQKVPAGSHPHRTNPSARFYLQIKKRTNLVEAHRWLIEQGIETSGIVGDQLKCFHFYDPDGNRLNAWSYHN